MILGHTGDIISEEDMILDMVLPDAAEVREVLGRD